MTESDDVELPRIDVGSMSSYLLPVSAIVFAFLYDAYVRRVVGFDEDRGLGTAVCFLTPFLFWGCPKAAVGLYRTGSSRLLAAAVAVNAIAIGVLMALLDLVVRFRLFR